MEGTFLNYVWKHSPNLKIDKQNLYLKNNFIAPILYMGDVLVTKI